MPKAWTGGIAVAGSWPFLTYGSRVTVTPLLSQGSIPFARGEEK
jgi:hypothetical protein